MIQELLLIILLAFIPACSNYFLDYCFGRPMSDEPSMKAIFHQYSIFLAKRQLKKNNLYLGIKMMYQELMNDENADVRNNAIRDFKKNILINGRDFFYTEQALGMCPYCTNFWFSEIAAAIFFFFVPLQFMNPIFFFILTPIFSHSILRKILKA